MPLRNGVSGNLIRVGKSLVPVGGSDACGGRDGWICRPRGSYATLRGDCPAAASAVASRPPRRDRGRSDRTPPMRLAVALVFATLVVGAGPGWAATLSDDEAMATPCRTYLSSSGAAIYGALIDAISNRLAASPNAARFGSTCNMGDYISLECKAHPMDDIRRALDRLERAGASGHLPRIPMCGA